VGCRNKNRQQILTGGRGTLLSCASSSLDQLKLSGFHASLGSTVHPQFLVNIRRMAFYRADRNKERFGDGLVAQADAMMG
jgi:hypothetical protein